MSTPPSPSDPNTPSTGEGSEKLGPAILISEGSTPPKEVSTSSSSSTSSSYSTTTSSSSSDSRQRRKRLAKTKLEEAKAGVEAAEAERELLAIEEEEAAEYGSNCSVYDMEWANPEAANDSSVDAGNGSTAGPTETTNETRRKVAQIPLTWFGLEETAPQVPSGNLDQLHADAPKPAADALQLIPSAPFQAAESSGSHNSGSLLGNAPLLAAPPNLLQNTLYQKITVNLIDLTPPQVRSPINVPSSSDPFANAGDWRTNFAAVASQWATPPPIANEQGVFDGRSNNGKLIPLWTLTPCSLQP